MSLPYVARSTASQVCLLTFEYFVNIFVFFKPTALAGRVMRLVVRPSVCFQFIFLNQITLDFDNLHVYAIESQDSQSI